MRRASLAFLLLCSACVLTGCGRRGPLEPPNPQAQSAAASANSAQTANNAKGKAPSDANDGFAFDQLDTALTNFGSGGRLERDTSSPLSAKIEPAPDFGPAPKTPFFLDPLL